MQLALRPPVAPMLAKLSRDLPAGDFVYEPKWDGFRCLVFRDGSSVDMRSRHQSPLSRYFPELVAGLGRLRASQLVLDGEIVVTKGGDFDFVALLDRLHPAASRVERLSRETPASFIAFDLLALGQEDLRGTPFAARRERLERVLEDAQTPIHVTPATRDRAAAAAWLNRFGRGGLDGVVAKHVDLPYREGKRAMVKVKQDRTADVVVAGFRWHGPEEAVGSLLLGLYDGDAVLHHVGLAASFAATRRRELLEDVKGYVAPIEGHPWEGGFQLGVSPVGRLPGVASRWAYGSELTWVPLRPELVCEVAYDHVESDRFRHPAKFRRWRPDRIAASCTYHQFEASTRSAVDPIPIWT